MNLGKNFLQFLTLRYHSFFVFRLSEFQILQFRLTQSVSFMIKNIITLIVCTFCINIFAVETPSPIDLLVAYPPGGLADQAARITATELSIALQRQVIVKNVPGANGARLINEVLNSNNKQISIILIDSSIIVAQEILGAAKVNLSKLQPIGILGRTSFAIVVPATSKIYSLSDLLNDFNNHSGINITYGTPGIYSIHHLIVELLIHKANINATHIPYQGGSQMINDIISERIDFGILSIPTANQYVKSNMMRAIAVTGSTRSSTWPSIPTLSEKFPELSSVSTGYIFASPNINNFLYHEILKAWSKILENTPIKVQLSNISMEGPSSNLNEFRTSLNKETIQWKNSIKIIN